MSIAIIVLIAIIHFYIYDHFWFLRLLGMELNNPKINLIFLLTLFYIAAIHQLAVSIKTEHGEKISQTGKQLVVPIFLYFILGIFTVILHEPDFDSIKRYFFYLFTPVMVSLSVFAIFRDNEKIKKTLFVLFLLGIILSAYSTVLHIKMKTDLMGVYHIFNPWVENQDMTLSYLSRLSIPGLGASNLPSMLTSLILAGIYFFKNSGGKVRYFYAVASLFLFYNIIITSTRGAFVSLLSGMIYLFVKGWFKYKRPLFAISVSLLVVFIFYFNTGLLLRLLSTVNQFVPSLGKLDTIRGLLNIAEKTI